MHLTINWCWQDRNNWLVMKWNDAWLSNKDCDGDGKLDRHYGYDSYIGSGAWLTNHEWGTYENDDGKTCRWDYFVKIVAAPEDASKLWDVSGDWTIEVNWKGTIYPHYWTLKRSSDGSFEFEGTGTAHLPNGQLVANEAITVEVIGDQITFTSVYENGYTWYGVGTISSDGTMSGTWTSSAGQSGTWQSTKGKATLYWYASDGTEIGPAIWGQFAIIQEVYNDPCEGSHGIAYLSPSPVGFGFYGK